MKKIFEGSLDLNMSPVSVKEVFAHLRPLVEFPARIKRLDVRISANVSRRVDADERRLTQALFNLATNAIKYTSAGKIEITAAEEVAATDQSKAMCIISVKDTGVGIRPEHLSEIFKIFGLADAKKDMTGTGTFDTHNLIGMGIGLYLVRSFVNKMNGRLTVESEVNRGTIFRIELPSHTESGGTECSLSIPSEILPVSSLPTEMLVDRPKEREGIVAASIHAGKTLASDLRDFPAQRHVRGLQARHYICRQQ